MSRRVSSDAQIWTEVLESDDLRPGDLDRPLLKRIACQKLGVAKVDEIASPVRTPRHMKRTHPKVFTGLGCMPGEYEIKLREGLTPLNLATPRRIPIPLQPRVREKLKRMEDMGVIEKVDQPTEWCSPVSSHSKEK